jgi:tetratricopeptide (TPR) repeat protein
MTDTRNQVIDASQCAVAREPTNDTLQTELGMAYFHAGRFDEALVAFHEAIRLNANAAAAYNGLGRVSYHRGPAEAAIAAFERAIEIDPHYRAGYWGLGILFYAQIGDFAAAIVTFKRALAHNPAEVSFHNGLGSTYTRMGRYEDAIAAFERASALNPADTQSQTGLQIVYFHLKRYGEAIAAGQRAIALQPAHSPHRVLGFIYFIQERFEESVAHLEQAIALDPNDYEARGALARVYRHVGRLSEGEQQSVLGRDLAAQDDEYGQACFASVCGNREEALGLLEVALAKKQLLPQWARHDPEFAFIKDEPRFGALVGV